MDLDIYSHIKNSTDIGWLKKLDEYVDIDISNIGSESDEIRKMKAKMREMSVKDIEKRQLIGFLDLKNKILKRIVELEI